MPGHVTWTLFARRVFAPANADVGDLVLENSKISAEIEARWLFSAGNISETAHEK